MSKGVDIISMSFTMSESRPELKKVIQRAENAGIVMMCSNHDEGANLKASYPAQYKPSTWVVTACDEYGFTPRERKLPTGEGYYMLQGLNVAAGVVPFLESNDRISGSSVATAIASGLSSLILSCARLNTCNPRKRLHGESCPGPCQHLGACREDGSHDARCPAFRGCVALVGDCEGENRRRIVSYFLDRIKSEQMKAEGYLLLERFGEIDAKVKEGEEIFVEDILRNWFSPERVKEKAS